MDRRVQPSRAPWPATAILLALLACPRGARADATPPDSIYLKNGGMLRGTLVDAIPGDHARIQLATQDIVTVQWSDVLRIEHAGDTPTQHPPSAATAEPSPAPSPASSPSGGAVWVHVEGADGARLEQDTTGDGDWTAICDAPCDRSLPAGFDYRVAGGGLRASGRVTLQGTPGARETLHVTPASSGWFVAGVTGMAIGGGTAYVGLFLGIFGSFGYTKTSGGTSTYVGPSPGLATAGWTMVAAGGVVALGGLALTLSNVRSGVTQDLDGGAPPSEPTGNASPQAATPAAGERAAMENLFPAAVTAPIVAGTF
jgi:hypothetical protein